MKIIAIVLAAILAALASFTAGLLVAMDKREQTIKPAPRVKIMAHTSGGTRK